MIDRPKATKGMTGDELYAARETLGRMWGLARPLHYSEVGRALRLGGRDPGETVEKWATGDGPTGPASVAIAMMLAGAPPPDPLDDILRAPPAHAVARRRPGGNRPANGD